MLRTDHQPTRERERRMRGFRLADQLRLSSRASARSQHFAVKRHLLHASLYRKQLAARFDAWRLFYRRYPKSVWRLLSGRADRVPVASDSLNMIKAVELNYLMTDPLIMDDSALQRLVGPIRKTSYVEGSRQTLAAVRTTQSPTIAAA